MIRRLRPDDRDALIAFLSDNRYRVIPMVRSIDRHGFRELYGHFSEEGLTGLFRFADSGAMQCVITDDRIFGKVDLFRLIRQKMPRVIRGPKASIVPIVDLLGKTLASHRPMDNHLMAYRGRPLERNVLGEERLTDGDQKFFLEAEKAFDRNFLSVNDLMRLRQRGLETKDLFCLRDAGQIVAQGMIEHEALDFCLLGGIYVANKHRGRGLGQTTTRELVAEVQRREKEPLLFVYEDNEPALRLYRKLGFEIIDTYTNLHTEMR